MRTRIIQSSPAASHYVFLGEAPPQSELVARLLAVASDLGITLSRELATRIAEKGEADVDLWIKRAHAGKDFWDTKRRFNARVTAVRRPAPVATGTVEDYAAKAKEEAERHAAVILAAANQAAAARAAKIQADADRAVGDQVAAQRAAEARADAERMAAVAQASAERAAASEANRGGKEPEPSTGGGLGSLLSNPVALGALGLGAFLMLKKK